MGIYRSISGTVNVRLTGADIISSVQAISSAGIQIHRFDKEGELECSFTLRRKDWQRAAQIARRKGDRIEIIKSSGIFLQIKLLLRRPLILVAGILMLVMTWLIPQRLLFISVEGNTVIPDRKILEAASLCDIRFGTKRSEIRSEILKNRLLSQIPELQWAGINTDGCCGIITVLERPAAEEPAADSGISSIVANRDGIITSVTVTEGTGFCRIGQAVVSGQTLISGYLDTGRILKGTDAQGEIFAATTRSLSVITPSEEHVRGAVTREVTKISLIIGKKRINLWNGSGISDASCVKMYSKYVLTLPGGFRLPAELVKETCYYSSVSFQTRREEAVSRELSQFAQNYLEQQMIAGSFNSRSEVMQILPDCFRMEGSYACTEMIGRRQKEMIGEYHGENDRTNRERGSG